MYVVGLLSNRSRKRIRFCCFERSECSHLWWKPPMLTVFPRTPLVGFSAKTKLNQNLEEPLNTMGDESTSIQLRFLTKNLWKVLDKLVVFGLHRLLKSGSNLSSPTAWAASWFRVCHKFLRKHKCSNQIDLEKTNLHLISIAYLIASWFCVSSRILDPALFSVSQDRVAPGSTWLLAPKSASPSVPFIAKFNGVFCAMYF